MFYRRALHFFHNVINGTGPPGVAGNGLRPHAEGAKRRAAAGCVKRNERVQEKRDVVIFNDHGVVEAPLRIRLRGRGW